ncbi:MULTISPECIES: 2-dehydropantoate 2-reductase [unclassified Caballeronia]|uniref:2-dehydropantoate 2-reductase n=1 Tax=unclassified Caballeronia TaxID=2646786 RepID=UPI002860A54D|nr:MULTISPECIES: 2-dehydropantoate 2-reductase [unclassified Caballeronia]MDR5818534.1 2-dehydropantoate 2-reductase [Caballeronia sp. LZ033]MDR5825501.1 2-dehydropantoate 2-reductase [Caballeronia sp. LZ043]MDR5883379.1 2-dehydropantoate 2-reductase [Caballeronia sp. LZ032]
MRILVVGAGAIGGYFGARLLEAGRDVTFLVRERRAERLRQCGLKVKSPEGDLTFACPPMTLAKDLDHPFDLVLLSCKAYDLQNAIDSFAPAVGPDTVILPLLNGMAHLDALDARFGAANVLGGQCVIAATLDAEGEIVHLNNMHSMTVGERAGGRSARIEAVAAQLDGAGFELNVSEDILQSMWDKWVFLATLATGTCLMRAPIGDILDAPGGEDVLRRLFMECQGVAADNDHPPPEAVIERARASFGQRGSLLTASMLRDLENGAPIEADHIVGDLIARRRSKVEGASMLEVAYAHLKAYEARRTRTASA